MTNKSFTKCALLVCALPLVLSCGGLSPSYSSSKNSDPTTHEGGRTIVSEQDEPTFFFLGSSVTYGATTGGHSFVENIDEDLQCNVVKEAVSGTNLANTKDDSYLARFLNRVDKEKEYEHFVIQLSTNDATNGLTYGEVSDSIIMDDFDTKTTAGSIEYLIAYISENFIADITFYTNPYYKNARYLRLVELLDQIVAKWTFVHVLDYYRYVDMEPLSEETLSSYMSDKIHPNLTGYKWMSEVMEDHLVSCYEANHPDLTLR